MVSRTLQMLLLAAAMAFSGATARPAGAQDEDVAALAAALKEAKLTLQEGLKASEREGQPISAQFEIDDGKLQLSIYTSKGDDFTEVIADANSGAVVRTEKITDSDDLNDAMDQKAALDKATISLLAAANTAEKENPGSRVVGIFPDIENGHAVAQVTLLQGMTAKKVTEKLD
jgi:hypothetical protein